MIFNITIPKSCSDCVFGDEGGYACNLRCGELCRTLSRPTWCPFDCDGETITAEGVKIDKLDGKKCEDICKYAPPENKWPCVDCDMRCHDRAEPKEE